MSCSQLLDANQELALQYYPAGIAKALLTTPGLGPSPAISQGLNIATINGTGVGIHVMLFLTPFANANYIVTATLQGATAGFCTYSNPTTNGVTINTFNAAGVATDLPFCMSIFST